jgi:hypothetical protein
MKSRPKDTASASPASRISLPVCGPKPWLDDVIAEAGHLDQLDLAVL